MNTTFDLEDVDQGLFRQEQLIIEATELIATIMDENKVSKAQLANRLGKSKAFVTQCLSGQQNLTLRTLADLFTALDYKASLGAEPSSHSCKVVHRLYPVNAWAFEKPPLDGSNVFDCAASAVKAPEDEICDAA